MARAFAKNSNAIFAECHSVEDAIDAINTHKPDIVFLDHNLSEYGDDGLTIVDRIACTGVQVYSITNNTFFSRIQ